MSGRYIKNSHVGNAASIGATILLALGSCYMRKGPESAAPVIVPESRPHADPNTAAFMHSDEYRQLNDIYNSCRSEITPEQRAWLDGLDGRGFITSLYETFGAKKVGELGFLVNLDDPTETDYLFLKRLATGVVDAERAFHLQNAPRD